MVAARAMSAYPDTPADTPISFSQAQVGVHVDRAWRDHPDLTAQQYATLTVAASKARGGRVTARLSTFARTLGRTGARAGEQVSRDLAQLERVGALSRSRTRRGAGVTDVRISRAAGGYDVIPWELVWAVQAGEVTGEVMRTWAVLDQAFGAKGRTRDSNGDLAAAARVTPRTVSRHLAQLEQIGLITRGSGTLRLLTRAGVELPTAEEVPLQRVAHPDTATVPPHDTEVGSSYDTEMGSMYLTPVTSLTPDSLSSSRSARHLSKRATRETSGRKRPTGGIYSDPKVSEVRDLLESVRAWRFGPRVQWQAGILSEALPFLEAGMAPMAVAHALVVRAECEIDEAIELDQPLLAAAGAGVRALAIDIRLEQACRHCGRDATEAEQLELTGGCCDWCSYQESDDPDEIPTELLQKIHADLAGTNTSTPADEATTTDPDTNSAKDTQEDEPMHTHTDTCHIEHGDYRCYVDHGCRRPECREAWRVYGATRNREIAYGRITIDHYVSGAAARVHIERLRRDGMSLKAISRESSVAPATISRIVAGHRTRTSTQDKILTVEPGHHELTDTAPGMALVNSAGTRRRLRALVVRGWTGARIADQLGCSTTNVNLALRKGEDEPTVAHFARTVRDLYEDLWDQEPPCANRLEEARARQVRNAAVERGWAPPMAWDEESIDDPAARAGRWREVSDLGSARRRIHVDNLEDCASWGLDLSGAAERLGVTNAAIEACARRAHRTDVLQRLRVNHLEARVA